LMTRAAVSLGPTNPMLRLALSAACRRHNASLSFGADVIDIVKDHRIVRIASKHFFYVLDMSRSFDFYFLQVDSERLDGKEIVDYSRPRVQRYRSSGLEFELSSFAEEEAALDGYFRWYRPKAGDVVFDLGAYCGVTTYHFSRMVGPTGKVYCFEPDTTNYPLLLNNVKRHNLTNVVPLQLAVAANSGTAQFNAEGALGSALSRCMPRASAGSTGNVEVISLPDACSRWGVPDFIKVDIEGAELEVLASAREFLAQNNIQFALDTNHWVNGVRTNAGVERLFAECGYEAESSEEYGFMTTWARKRDASSDCARPT